MKGFATLKFFIRRSNTLSLYRSFLRTIRKTPSKQERLELTAFVRQEFDQHSNETDDVNNNELE